MTSTVARLADRLGATLRGDGSVEIDRLDPIAEATPRSITYLADLKHLPSLVQSSAGAVLVEKSVPLEGHSLSLPVLVVDDVLVALEECDWALRRAARGRKTGIDPHAAVDESAQIGEDVWIGPFAVVEADTVIGDGCTIHPHAVIREGSRLEREVEIHPHAVLYPRTVVGERTIVHAGAVLGGDGFGYAFRDGKHCKVPQLGSVELGADVEIGANTTIDRGAIGPTRVGEGTKLDNLVMIAHNCQLGKHNIFAGQVGMAGSSTTGDYVVVGGQAGIADHVSIGDRTKLGACAGVFFDVPADQTYLGAPARPMSEARRIHLSIERLPNLFQHVAEVRTHLGMDAKHKTRHAPSNGRQRKAAG